MTQQTVAQKMMGSFLNWFHQQQGIESEQTNVELVKALCWHVASAWHYTEFEVARGTGTTTTLTKFAEWAYMLEVVKPERGRFERPGTVLVTSRWRDYQSTFPHMLVAGWGQGFRGYRKKLILCEVDYTPMHSFQKQQADAKLASVHNSVFVITYTLVDMFLAAVDS
jgi:hypothetical protein